MKSHEKRIQTKAWIAAALNAIGESDGEYDVIALIVMNPKQPECLTFALPADTDYKEFLETLRLFLENGEPAPLESIQ